MKNVQLFEIRKTCGQCRFPLRRQRIGFHRTFSWECFSEGLRRLGWVARASYCMVAVIIILSARVFSGQTAAAATQPPGREQEKDRDGAICYRTPENDVVNCLYLQLRLLGYKESYEAFRKQFPDDPRSLSLQSLANLGRKFGFWLVPVKLTVAELAKARTPAIVHFEEGKIGSGQFHLFLGMDDSSVALIDGSYVLRTEMSRDLFRRNWTGYALIARPPTVWGLWVRRCVVVLVIVGVVIWLTQRTRILSVVGVIHRAKTPVSSRGANVPDD